MKFYPKASVCPHCRTVYRRSDLKKILWKKQAVCYHCRKSMRVSRKSFWLLAAETAAVYAVVNIFSLGVIQGLSFIGLFVINLFPALAAMWLMPYYIELQTDKKEFQKSKNNA